MKGGLGQLVVFALSVDKDRTLRHVFLYDATIWHQNPR
jgi:hypothetical protein